MELLLWRWSTLVQVTSDLMIAGFFVALAYSLGRAELRVWVNAWLANLAALLVTIAFWLWQPDARLTFALAISLYLFAKTMFVLLLVDGAVGFAALRPPPVLRGKLMVAAAVFSIVGGFVIRTVDQLGLAQAVVICVCLGASAVFLIRRKERAYGWLATGFAIRSALAAAEATAYAVHWSGGDALGASSLPIFIASHSSFDTGAEWVIALGCVLTLYAAIQQELTQANGELRSAQGELHALLDRDQLTGVFNRRALPTMLHEAKVDGATILFFDLDDFKKVNDLHGHHTGDPCLVRFARMLSESFPAGDRVIRYAGDEFVVVAQELEQSRITQRVEAVRTRLRVTTAEAARIDFSCGSSLLPPQGDPDAALREADQAMYCDKSGRAG
ncbi:MAG: GGDEF domain-containing protein [Dokdonella sp.]